MNNKPASLYSGNPSRLRCLVKGNAPAFFLSGNLFRKYLAGSVFLLLTQVMSAQHLIGIYKDEAQEAARKEGFFQDRMTTSQAFNYLKFVNTAGTKTLILYFSDSNISTHSKLICDYSELDAITGQYNRSYKRTGKNEWEYSFKKDTYTVTLREEEWYFTVRVKKK